MEDDRVAVLEQQLQQARYIAEDSDKKYEEVRNSLVSDVISTDNIALLRLDNTYP